MVNDCNGYDCGNFILDQSTISIDFQGFSTQHGGKSLVVGGYHFGSHETEF